MLLIQNRQPVLYLCLLLGVTMRTVLLFGTLLVLFTTSALAQYTGMPGTGGPRPQTEPRPQPGPAPMPGPAPLPIPDTTGPLPAPIPYPYPAPQYRTYAAVAFSQYTGAHGYAAGFQSEHAAAQSALNYCGPSCRVIAVASGAYIALAVGRGNGFGYAITSESLEAAKGQAIRNCREHTRRCRVRAYVYSP